MQTQQQTTVNLLSIRARTLANMGRLEESRQQFDLGMRIARDRGDLEPLGWLHSLFLDLAWFAGDAAAAHSHARHAVEIAEKIGVPGSENVTITSGGTTNTTEGDLPWDVFVSLLRPRGTLSILGFPKTPVTVGASGLMLGRRKITGSMIGGPAEAGEGLPRGFFRVPEPESHVEGVIDLLEVLAG